MMQLQTINNNELVNAGMNDFYERFLSYIQTTDATKKVYARQIKQYMQYLIKNGINDPKRLDIQNYIQSLKDKGLKPTTIQNYLIAVKQFYNFLEVEYDVKNIAKGLKAPKVSRNHKKDNLSMEQVAELLKNIDASNETGARDKAIILLMVTTATRTIEIHRATVEDLRNTDGKTVLYVQGKGHTEKDTPVIINAVVKKAINDYLKFRDASTKRATSPLFTSTSNNSKGKAITTRTISSIVKSRLQAVGIDSPRITAHSLRHTGITEAYKQMRAKGVNDALAEVQRYARHQSPTTSQIYIHEVEQKSNVGADLVTDALLTALS